MKVHCFVLFLLSGVAAGAGGRSRAPDRAAVPRPTPKATKPQTDVIPRPPADARHLCSGHVTGAPRPDGEISPHITWDAYSSQETTAAVAARYLAVLGAAGHTRDGTCETWRRPADKPRAVVQVCPPGATGPWSTCAAPPANARSIVILSSIAMPR